MLRKFLITLLAACMLLISGCAAQGTHTQIESIEEMTNSMIEDPEPDYLQIYTPILDQFLRLFTDEPDTVSPSDGETGVWEEITGLGQNQAALQIGYTLYDISGDRIPELLVGSTGTETSLYAVYTCKDEIPVLCISGWARNRYYLCSGSTLLNEGSNGAMYTIWGTYSLTADGTAANCLDFYFTHEKGNDFSDIRYYHNNTGEWDPAASEEMEITDEQFWRLHDDAASRISHVPMVSFAEYGRDKLGSFVRANQLADTTELPEVYTEITANSGVEESKILFTPVGTIRNFKLLNLTYVQTDNAMGFTFQTEEIYSTDLLTKDTPVIFGTTFYGAIPNNAIQYTNDKGITRTYALEISGYDGSLLLNEIETE